MVQSKHFLITSRKSSTYTLDLTLSKFYKGSPIIREVSPKISKEKPITIERVREDLKVACRNGRSCAVAKLLRTFMKKFPGQIINEKYTYDNCLYEAVRNNHRNVVKEFLKFNQTKFKEYIEPLLLDGMNDEEEHEQNPNEDDGSQVGDDGSQVGDVELQADLHKNNNGAQTDAISPEVEDTVGAVRASTLTRDAAHIGEKKNQYQHKKKTYTHDILVEMMHKMPDLALTILNKYCTEVDSKDSKPIEDKEVPDYVVDVDDVVDPYLDNDTYDMDYYDDDEYYSQNDSDDEENTTKLFRCDYLLMSYPSHQYSENQNSWERYRASLMNYSLWSAHEVDNLAIKEHPLIASLLYYKWLKARKLYYVIMLWYILYTALITAYVLMFHEDQFPITSKDLANYTQSNDTQANDTQSNNTSNSTAAGNDMKKDSESTFHMFYCYVIVIAACIGLIGETIQAIGMKWMYISDNLGELLLNIIDVSLYLCSLLFAIPVDGVREDYQWKTLVYVLFCSWFSALLHHPVFGTYLIMVLDVVKETLRFSIMYIIFMVSFAISFFALLKNQDAFYSFTSSIRRTWTMMVGDIGFNDIFHPDEEDQQINNRGAVVVLFYIFLFLSIIIMNMWTGFVINRMAELELRKPLQRYSIQLKFIVELESFLPECLLPYFTFQCDQLERRTITLEGVEYEFNTIHHIHPEQSQRTGKLYQIIRIIRILLGDTVTNHFERSIELKNYDHEDNRDVLDNMHERFDTLEAEVRDQRKLIQEQFGKLNKLLSGGSGRR